jgi:hypothetical protein
MYFCITGAIRFRRSEDIPTRSGFVVGKPGSSAAVRAGKPKDKQSNTVANRMGFLTEQDQSNQNFAQSNVNSKRSLSSAIC